MPTTRQAFAKAVILKLDELELRPDYRYRPTLNAIDALVNVMVAEGTAARFNPLATTYQYNGSTGLAGNPAGVQEYKTKEDGVHASARTLQSARYNKVTQSLRNNWLPQTTMQKWHQSDWGTKFGDGSYADVMAFLRGVESRWGVEAFQYVPE